MLRARSTHSPAVALFSVLALGFALLVGCERPFFGEGHYDAPLVRLLSNPDSYDSKWVLTSGFLRFGLNGPALFFSEGDAAHGVTSNSVAVVFSSEVEGDDNLRASVNQKYVAITGLFKNLGTGDLMLTSVDVAIVYSNIEDEVED